MLVSFSYMCSTLLCSHLHPCCPQLRPTFRKLLCSPDIGPETKTSVVARACNPHALEAEAGGLRAPNRTPVCTHNRTFSFQPRYRLECNIFQLLWKTPVSPANLSPWGVQVSPWVQRKMIPGSFLPSRDPQIKFIHM